MIFLTVGTQFPFDRLVRAIDRLVEEGVVQEEVFGQIGHSAYQPHHFKTVAALEKRAFDDCVRQASAIISHAGIGVIMMALDNGKPLLVMPRRPQYKEVVNDHQAALAEKFEAQGYLLAAQDETQLGQRVERLKGFVPRPRQASPEAVADRIGDFLKAVRDRKNRR
jgi:beta-1,4-N-acetylglucosaminyltransferase